jgi:Cft2 family RNA processing exonuclease
MESTFGDPVYAFPPQNEVYSRIVMFIQSCFAENNTPVLVGYAMGKAQEAVALAQGQKFKVCVDSAVEEVNELYRAAGIKLQPTNHYLSTSLTNKVVVISPQTLKQEQYQAIKRKRSLFLSGWAQGGNGKRFGTDSAVPLSDHADFSQLLYYIDQCQPAKILTLHGNERFAVILRERGYDAEYIGRGAQGSSQSDKPAKMKSALVHLKGQNLELFSGES